MAKYKLNIRTDNDEFTITRTENDQSKIEESVRIILDKGYIDRDAESGVTSFYPPHVITKISFHLDV